MLSFENHWTRRGKGQSEVWLPGARRPVLDTGWGGVQGPKGRPQSHFSPGFQGMRLLLGLLLFSGLAVEFFKRGLGFTQSEMPM